MSATTWCLLSVSYAKESHTALHLRSKFLYFYFVSTFSVFNRGDGRYVQSWDWLWASLRVNPGPSKIAKTKH